MKKFSIYVLFAAMLAMTSCLFENDMAYPDIPADIVTFEVEGQESVNIDTEKKIVEVVLDEVADMSHLKVVAVAVSDQAKLLTQVPEYIDLTDTLSLVLMTYMEHEWKVTAVQPIDRYITVSNQVGEAELDVANRSAVVYVSDTQNLSDVEFLDMKLEPEGSVVRTTTGPAADGSLQTLACAFPMSLDCVHRRSFLVNYKGDTYEWYIKVLKKKISQQITKVEPWCYHAKVYGLYTGKGEAVIEYRKDADAEWTVAQNASYAGVGITVDIQNLEASTEYLVRVVEDGARSSEFKFTTDTPVKFYNMNFDEWNLQGKIWYPYALGANPSIWDSANPGAATFIGSSTSPEESFVVKGKAARMESKYAVIAFAAGNIYTGKFGKIAGVGAELDWGVPFEGRPVSLKGYYSYSPKPIGYAKPPHEDKIGQTDRCQITVLLTDWDKPFRINTTTGTFVDVKNDPGIIAFARLETGEDTGGKYKEFTLPLEYRDKTRRPKYVVIACAASYLGDYFTGGGGSTMHGDEFEFIYE